MKKPKLPHSSGVYKIVNTSNNKCYIGSTNDFNTRFNEHLSYLKRNKHHSIYLQRAYNKYGADKFKFEIIEECISEKCIEREQFYLDTILFASENNNKFRELGYNLRRLAASNRGYKWTEKSKKKLSLALKGKFKGIKHPQAKLIDAFIKDILLTALQTDLSNTEIAKQFGVSKTTINYIIRGKTWSHISLDDPYWNDKLNELRNSLRKMSEDGMCGKGENGRQSRFLEKDIFEMRRLINSGLSQNKVAKMFNTSQGALCNIVKYKSWKHLDWLQQSLYEWVRTPEFKERLEKIKDIEFGVSATYMLERLVISHVRLWNLENEIRNESLSHEERSNIKKQIDYINSKIRPRLIQSIGDCIAKAYYMDDMSYIKEPNLKSYGNENVS